LPNHDRAVIDPRKISAYLLSVTHPVGRHKWRFFQALGFTPDDLGRLDHALRTIARTGALVQEVATRFGVRYIVDGTFTAPNGTTASVRTVWIIETGGTEPRFVTAFPQRPAKGSP
jgi:hypothetical protein